MSARSPTPAISALLQLRQVRNSDLFQNKSFLQFVGHLKSLAVIPSMTSGCKYRGDVQAAQAKNVVTSSFKGVENAGVSFRMTTGACGIYELEKAPVPANSHQQSGAQSSKVYTQHKSHLASVVSSLAKGQLKEVSDLIMGSSCLVLFCDLSLRRPATRTCRERAAAGRLAASYSVPVHAWQNSPWTRQAAG